MCLSSMALRRPTASATANMIPMEGKQPPAACRSGDLRPASAAILASISGSRDWGSSQGWSDW